MGGVAPSNLSAWAMTTRRVNRLKASRKMAGCTAEEYVRRWPDSAAGDRDRRCHGNKEARVVPGLLAASICALRPANADAPASEKRLSAGRRVCAVVVLPSAPAT